MAEAIVRGNSAVRDIAPLPARELHSPLGLQEYTRRDEIIFEHSIVGRDEILGSTEMGILWRDFTVDMMQVAPDLRSRNLAEVYSLSLFAKLTDNGATPLSLEQLIQRGSEVFYGVGKDVLGPHAAQFVHAAMDEYDGHLIFPKRDADPLYVTARTLKHFNPDAYLATPDMLHNPVFNRKLWGVNDELDEGEVKDASDARVNRLLRQIGFYSGKQVRFVEIGCWGTMIDALRKQTPDQDFSVFFLFTHQPDNIYGFLNRNQGNLDIKVLETIADTWEAFPKYLTRMTDLVEMQDGRVAASVDRSIVNSPLLYPWAEAALGGVAAAAMSFVENGNRVVREGKEYSPQDELERLAVLKGRAGLGEFTGILPFNTETWSEGAAWKANWPHGKIPPLAIAA